MRKSYKELKRLVKANYVLAYALTPPNTSTVNAYRIFRRKCDNEMYLLRKEDWTLLNKFIRRYINNKYKHHHIEKRISNTSGRTIYKNIYSFIDTDIWEKFLDIYEYDYYFWDDYEMGGDWFDDPQENKRMKFYKIS